MHRTAAVVLARAARPRPGMTMLVLAAMACGEQDRLLAPGAVRAGADGGTVALAVEGDLPLARLLVTIDDGRERREVELRREAREGLVAGAIELVPGVRARLTFRGYDADGAFTHEGEGAVEPRPDETAQVELALHGRPGASDASVRVGTYRLAMTPSAIAGRPREEHVIEAMLLDAHGNPHPVPEGTLEWMPAEGDADIGDIGFDPSEIGVQIRFLLERWFTGRMKVCSVGRDRVCGSFVVRDPTPVVQVTAGYRHTCVRRPHGGVSCWGDNSERQVGRDAALQHQLVGIVFSSIDAGLAFTCGLDDQGAVRCWGANNEGQLGRPLAVTASASPDVVPGLPGTATMVTAGDRHACALLSSGSTWCWGSNGYGQLGDSSVFAAPRVWDSVTPVQVKHAPAFVTISAGNDHTCGLTAAGSVWCWGINWYGETGIDPAVSDHCGVLVNPQLQDQCVTTARKVPTTLVFAGLGGGKHATCAHTSAGVGYCWGYAYFGYNPSSGYHVPRKPTSQPAWRRFVAGNGSHCGIDAADIVQCFGVNTYGYLGTGQSLNYTTTPSPIAMPGTWSDLGLGSYHGCAILTGGASVACWGHNDRGQLGAVTATDHSLVPLTVTVDY